MQHRGHSFRGVFIHLLSLLTLCVTLGTLLANPAAAAPVNDVDAPIKKLFGRACPTVDALGQYMTSQGAGENTVFYTSPATNQQASALSTTLSPKGYYYGNLVTRDQTYKWLDECGFSPTEQDKLVPRISRAIASITTGTAYILIPPGADPKAGSSIWVKHEFPTLMRSGCQKVIRVDPDDITATSTIWKSGDPTDLPESTA